jgi:hypothetical protein
MLINERQAFPEGGQELHEFMMQSGETTADLEFEARAELASMKLHEMVLAGAPSVTEAEVSSYYATHRQRFFVPEWREVLITNRKSAQAARKLRHELEAGRNTASLFRHEAMSAPTEPTRAGGADAPGRAILLTPLHHFGGPVRQRIDWFIFKVIKLRPAKYRTLAEVQGEIERLLEDEARRRALAQFARAWRERWVARTSCRAADVIPGCREYRGTGVPDGPFVTAH